MNSSVAKRPNILMIFPDQWRGDWVHSVSGIPVRTPNIDDLVASGVSFGRTWTPCPICAPARACLATGRHYDASPVRHNMDELPLGQKTFYLSLLESGYRVANLGKSDLLKGAQSWGPDGRHRINEIDRMAAIGFSDGFDSAGKHDSINAANNGCNDPYTDMLSSRHLIDDYLRDYENRKLKSHPMVPLSEWLDGSWFDPPQAYTNVEPVDIPDDAYSDNFIGNATLDTLKNLTNDEPWFIIANFPGPHEPMDITKQMAVGWTDVDLPLPVGCHHPDIELVKTIRRHYAAMMENIDTWIGRFVDQLKKQGNYENTLIVFASDHGEMLGDRNLWQKEVPFEPAVHVPLVISGPGVVQRGNLPNAVGSLIDLPPTFLKLAGVPIPDDYSGHDMSAYLSGDADTPRHYTQTGLGSWRAVTDGRYKLFVGLDDTIPQVEIQFGKFDGSLCDHGQLYDLQNDPNELSNLWDQEVTIREKLLALLPEPGLESE